MNFLVQHSLGKKLLIKSQVNDFVRNKNTLRSFIDLNESVPKLRIDRSNET